MIQKLKKTEQLLRRPKNRGEKVFITVLLNSDAYAFAMAAGRGPHN